MRACRVNKQLHERRQLLGRPDSIADTYAIDGVRLQVGNVGVDTQLRRHVDGLKVAVPCVGHDLAAELELVPHLFLELRREAVVVPRQPDLDDERGCHVVL